MTQRDFDIDHFLDGPLTARLATSGPIVRPVWYLWEEGRFWILTGPWSRVQIDVAADPEVAAVIDPCDLTTGECLQVVAGGYGELISFDRERGCRMLERYLGRDHDSWDTRFLAYLSDEGKALWLKVTPRWLTAKDLSFAPSLRS